MHKLLVASVVAASLAWLPSLSRVAAQEATADGFFASAKYVALGYGRGDRFVSEIDAEKSKDLSNAEKVAFTEIRKQIEDWHRFVLTSFPEAADLLIAVRVGKRAELVGSVPIGGRQPTGVGGQAQSSTDDYLYVYQVTRGRVGPQIWEKHLSKGLSGSPAPLFEALRIAVEAASK